MHSTWVQHSKVNLLEDFFHACLYAQPRHANKKKDICLDPSEPDCEAPEPSRKPSHCSSAVIKIVVMRWTLPSHSQDRFPPNSLSNMLSLWSQNYQIGKDYYKDHHNCGELYRSEPLWRTLHKWAVVVSSSGVSRCGDLHEWAVVVSFPWLSCCGELSMSELLWWALHKWIVVVSSPWVSCCGNHPRSKAI